MKIILSILLLSILYSCAPSTNKSKINDLFEGYNKAYYELNPVEATADGINDYNDKLAIDISPEYITSYIGLNEKYLERLGKIPPEELSDQEKLSIEILKYRLTVETEGLKLGFWGINRPVNQFVFSFPQEFATLGSGKSYVPFNTEQDYDNFKKRMVTFADWVDQAIKNMKTGLETGDTNPKEPMEKVPAQLRPLFEGSIEENIFFQPIKDMPAEIDSAARNRIEQSYKEIIGNIIQPTYKKLHDFLIDEYIPNVRETSGLIYNKDGVKEYVFWLHYYTTMRITAEDIYNLGLSEVDRIRTEMDSLKKQVGFQGDLKAFFEYVKSDPKFFPFTSEEQVLDRYRSFQSTMEPYLSKLFNLKPKAEFEVRATEKFREASANAQYIPASPDGKRPGIFYETVRDPKTYNYIDMESLFMHEAIPGHHYQSSIQQEADIPEFRKSYWTSAFGEGWALYAESLGSQLGLYKDPYQYFGRLNNEMERAVRLVVDAGIHYKGWPRAKAIYYVLENQPVTRAIAEQRIDRYMVTPGQAVSYKVGEKMILSLKKYARKELGDQFDIREFHDQILKNGCLPLIILEKQIDEWIREKKNI